MTDQELREAFGARPPPQAACGAPPEPIWRAAVGEARPEEARVLLEHAAGCADCHLLWGLARELAAASGEVRQAPAVRAPPRWGRLAAAGLAAAAAAAALLLLARRAPPPPAPLRAPRTIGGGPAARPLLAEGRLPRADFRLRWSEAAPGATYTVSLMTLDLQLVYARSGVVGTELLVPAAALAGQPPGARLAWRVETVLPDGEREAGPSAIAELE